MSNTNKNIELNCEIVRDLLPLYHDGVVSDSSKLAVEKHLEVCEPCKNEYEELSAELSIESTENNTKNTFIKMMSKQKVKRICILITSIVLTCVLVISTMFVLTEVPLVKVPETEIKIYNTYGYETETGYEFFILYNINAYECMFFGLGEHKDDIQYLEAKRPIISDELGTNDEVWFFEYEYFPDDAENIDYLLFGGDIIWSKEENKNDKIPEYVYEYNSEKFEGMDIDAKNERIEYYYTDGTTKKWTFDGKVIKE